MKFYAKKPRARPFKRRARKSNVRKSVGRTRPTYRKRRSILVGKVKMNGNATNFTRSIVPMHPLCRKVATRLKIYPKQTYFVNASAQCAVAIGLQNILDISIGSIGQLAACFNQLNPQGGAISAANGNVYNTSRWYLTDIYSEISFSNSSSNIAFVDFYEWAVRDDTGVLPSTLWSEGLQDGTGALAGNLYKTVGLSMMDAITAVGVFYRLKKIHKFILNPGQTHVHVHKSNLCRLIDNYMIGAGDAQTTGYLTNITTVYSMVAHGGIASIPASGTVTYGPCNIDVIQQTRLHAKFAPYNVSKMYITNTLPATGLLSALNPGSGVAAVPAAI